ncbi:MAG: hypothetical protein HWN68_13855 [Desulfobacterales bacterium]|nr:hypothetical protein [Desulfobacterales bacterium]
MRLYWDHPKSQRIPHDQKLLFVEFGEDDKNVRLYGYLESEGYLSIEWVPTYDEVLAILEALLRGPK